MMTIKAGVSGGGGLIWGSKRVGGNETRFPEILIDNEKENETCHREEGGGREGEKVLLMKRTSGATHGLPPRQRSNAKTKSNN